MSAAAILGLIGSLISAIPGIFTTGAKIKAVKDVTGTVIDVSHIARNMLTDYLKISREVTDKELEHKLKELDSTHAFALEKLEREFQHKLIELGVKEDVDAAMLASHRLRLLELEMQSESWLDTGWRRLLRWNCVLVVVLTTLFAAIVGAVSVYYPALHPLFIFLTTEVATEKVYTLLGIIIGVAYTSRSVEKIMGKK